MANLNPLAWLLLGVFALPLAAILYGLAKVLGPHVLEPVPAERVLPLPSNVQARGRWLRLSAAQMTALRMVGGALVLALVGIGVNRWPAAGPTRSVAPAAGVQLPPPAALRVQTRAGVDGSGPGQLHDPRDVAVDQAGNVYVADTGNKRIIKFRPDGSFVQTWTNSATGALAEPSSVAVAKDGVIVDDSEAGQLHKFDFDGKPVAGFEHDLGLSHPRGVAVGPDGTIYVGDTADNRIVTVGPDGTLRGNFDTKGTKLEQPTGVAVDDQGSVYSVEPAASRIQKFAADGTLQANLFLPSAVTLYPPRALWIPNRGLVVALPDQNELLRYGPAGVPQTTYAAESPAPLRPLGLALTPDRQAVWVVWNTSSTLTELLWP
ncbi:MAG TPA: NHL repeat-containing protein [Chloroflexota bacterium]|nr:NHL repeat-containing protein [Chloroflexota bacterium]